MTVACDAENEVYSHVDCDGDGILDHACRTRNHENHWLILSSEGCRNCWGTSNRCVSECPAAWPSKGNENIQLFGLWLNSFFNHTNVFIKNGKKKSRYLMGKFPLYFQTNVLMMIQIMHGLKEYATSLKTAKCGTALLKKIAIIIL